MYTVKKIKKTYSTHLECVIKYFHILNILNSLSLSENDIFLLSFACMKGNITGGMEEYVQTFQMSRSSFRNGMLKLVKRGFLVKEGKKTLLNKQLHIEFDFLILNISINA